MLYLVRHAHAVSAEEDPARPLSLRGVADMKRVAEFFRSNHAFAPDQLWHSSLVRARQTAEILVSELQLEGALVETTDLLPEDDPQDLLARIAAFASNRSLALIGHEPHMSALATLLIRGKDRPAAFDFKKGAVLALERGEGVHKRNGEPRWQIRWFVTPGLLSKQAADAEND